MDSERILETALRRVELRGGEVQERREIARPGEVAFEFHTQVHCSTTMTTTLTGGGRNTDGNLLGTSGWTLDVSLETLPPRWSDDGAEKEATGIRR